MAGVYFTTLSSMCAGWTMVRMHCAALNYEYCHYISPDIHGSINVNTKAIGNGKVKYTDTLTYFRNKTDHSKNLDHLMPFEHLKATKGKF